MQMPSWVEWVGVVGFVTNVWGNLMLARLKRGGWMVRLLTNVLWMVYSLNTSGGWPLLLNHLTFFYLNVDGYIHWRRAQQTGVLRTA